MYSVTQARVGRAFVLLGLVLIFVTTLSPFTFDFRLTIGAKRLALWPSSFLDLPRNILLFIPLGIGLALLWRTAASRRLVWSIVLMSLGITLLVEMLQFFLPKRSPNLSDVAANTFGGYLGWLCFSAWLNRHWWFVQSFRTWRPAQVAAVSGVYLLLAVALARLLPAGFRPSGWDPSFRLAFGNELTGDRPWNGSSQNIMFLDRQVNADEAHELLRGSFPAALEGAVLGLYPLAGSVQPVAGAAERINATGEFTLALTVATSDLNQRGPARIVTISKDPFERNFTVGQEGNHLAVRWRSKWTGTNAVTPELQFPGVFVSREPSRVVLCLGQNRMTLYTTRRLLPVSVLLGPELAAAALLKDGNRWQLKANSSELFFSSIALPFLIYVPLGMASGFAATSGTAARFLPTLAITCPALMYEFIFDAWAKTGFRWLFFGLGMFLTAAGLLAVRAWRYYWNTRA